MKEPFQAGETYHVYNRTNGYEALFREDQNHLFFLMKYKMYLQQATETISWCLLPNHFHLMVRVYSYDEYKRKKIKSLNNNKRSKPAIVEELEYGKFISKSFSRLFSSYTQSYNKFYSRYGSLFQPNMKRKRVDSDEYFRQLVVYIHNNPVNHGYVKDLSDWKWSSIHEYVQDKNPIFKLVSDASRSRVMELFQGERQFHESHRRNFTDFAELLES